MNKSIQCVLSLSLAVFCLANAMSQNSDESMKKSLSSFDNAVHDTIDSNSTFLDPSSPDSSQNQIPSQILLTCLCVPYYRCDPGHWEKTEDDHCTRFMHVCCYGSEAIDYAIDQE